MVKRYIDRDALLTKYRPSTDGSSMEWMVYWLLENALREEPTYEVEVAEND